MHCKAVTGWLQRNGLAIIVFCVVVWLFSYRMDYYSLAPWDEAWYAVVAKNVIKSGNWLDLTYNNKPFWDHPPLGIYLEAISFWVLGISETAARLPMVLVGALTVTTVYLFGKIMGGKWSGLAASCIVISSRWFWWRARTANLEMPLLLAQVLTVYLAFKAKTKAEIMWMWFCFALAMLSKSVIAVTIAPLALIATYRVWRREGFSWWWLVVLVGPLAPWYGFNTLKYGWEFLNKNIFVIGLRRGDSSGVNREILDRTLLYLRSAVHRWYQPLLGTSAMGVFLLKSRTVRWSLGYLLLVSFPYFLSKETQIWHLLPIIPAMAMVIVSVLNSFGKRIAVLGSVLVLGIAGFSIGEIYKEIIPQSKNLGIEAQIGIAAGEVNYPVYTQDNTYLPTLIFYADKDVTVIPRDKKFIERLDRPFVLVTQPFMIEDITGYREIRKIGDNLVLAFD